jgi:DNA invertase Pin-like site-specific DNA recombinase
MTAGNFVAYYRVSTDKQERSGLGLAAQQKAVRDYLNGGDWNLRAECVEVESGKVDHRPKLEEALRLCRIHDATLVIARLDRLSRDAHFLTGLQKAAVKFVAVDMPHADNFTVGIMAMLAQKERELISERTRVALAAAKAKGKKLGNPENLKNVERGRSISAEVRTKKARQRAADLAPTIEEIRASGIVSLNGIATALNARGIPTPRGGTWGATQVKNLLEKVR